MITDTIGITSQFTYDYTDNNPTFINSLTTPYGTTTFIDEDFGFNGQFWYGNNYGIGTLGLEAVDPLGQHERWEMDLVLPDSAIETNPAVPNITVDDGQRGDRGLNVANTVYWNKAAYAASQAEGLGLNQQYWDYSKAYIYHWFSDLYNDGQTTGILDSEKPPLENRIGRRPGPEPVDSMVPKRRGHPTSEWDRASAGRRHDAIVFQRVQQCFRESDQDDRPGGTGYLQRLRR